MPKTSSIFICQQCGFRSSQFLGKCPECNTWNSLVEEFQEIPNSLPAGRQGNFKIPKRGNGEVKIVNLKNIEKEHIDRINTGIGEFNRVLGDGPASPSGSQGGIVPGSVVLVSGDPGIGKSTLLLQLALGLNQKLDIRSEKMDKEVRDLKNVLYIAGEESARQIKIRAERIKKDASLEVLNEVDVDRICETIENMKLDVRSGLQHPISLIIIDSIQTLETSDLSSPAGSIGQVRECAYRLQNLAKSLHIPIFLVGHVNKEGNIAGPKTLEHLVDVVLSLEGEPSSGFRILRASKNRFGPTDEVGIFEMGEEGMKEVLNPSKLFLTPGTKGTPGSVVTTVLTGQRPLLAEIQALVTKSFFPVPLRRASGIDGNRLQLLTAVLTKRLGLPLFNQDIFVNVTGGLKVLEPSADLAICLAIVSSFKDEPLKEKTVVLGEVGLLGEVRSVGNLGKRVNEAKKLGFVNVISPEEVKSLAEAVKAGNV